MERQLFLIMSSNNESHYCFHRISEPETPSEAGDETIIRSLGEPVFKMDKSIFSKLMSFAAVDSRIFIVGGFSYDEKNRLRASKNVFIYDTVSSDQCRGPSLNYGKVSPHLFTLDSKLFALSDLLYTDDRKSSSEKRKVMFEVLDTSKLGDGWSALAIPTLCVSDACETTSKYSVYALVAMHLDGGYSGGVVFVSVAEAGTYVFDISRKTWNFVSDNDLPFSGQGSPIPHTSSLCCGISTKCRAFCVFRFSYGSDDKNGLQIHEIKIEDPYSLSPPLPPLIFPRPVLMVQGVGGRFFLVESGADKPGVARTLDGNRYVKVSAYEFSNLKLNEEEEGQSPNRCKTKSWLVRHKELDTQLKLTGLWRTSFFGGPVCNPLTHVEAAFAM